MLKTKKSIERWLNKIGVHNYEILSDLTVNVKGAVHLEFLDLKEIPVQFGSISGSFYCFKNQLTSLKGAPHVVDGDFYCYMNCLDTLEYCPTNIKGSFDCSNNSLKNLKHSPEYVGEDFICNNNLIKTLKYSPHDIGGNFHCLNNPITKINNFKGRFGGEFKHAHLVIENMKEFYTQDPTFKTEKSLRLTFNEFKTIIDYQNMDKKLNKVKGIINPKLKI